MVPKAVHCTLFSYKLDYLPKTQNLAHFLHPNSARFSHYRLAAAAATGAALSAGVEGSAAENERLGVIAARDQASQLMSVQHS